MSAKISFPSLWLPLMPSLFLLSTPCLYQCERFRKLKARLNSKVTQVTCLSPAATPGPSMAPGFLGCSRLPGPERNVQSAAHRASGNMPLIQQECGSIHRVYGTVAFEVQPQNFVAVKMVVIYRKMSLGCLLYKSFLQLSLNINQTLSRQQNDGFGITFARRKEKG